MRGNLTIVTTQACPVELSKALLPHMTIMFPAMSSTFSSLSLRFSRFSFHAPAFFYCFWPLHNKSFHLMTQRKDNCVVSHHTFWQSGTRVLMSKAKEALQKHDQEIQSLSNKAISSPKVRGMSFSLFLIISLFYDLVMYITK
ncbi:hypothetical protein HN51_046404 [Arachis hypogaea]